MAVLTVLLAVPVAAGGPQRAHPSEPHTGLAAYASVGLVHGTVTGSRGPGTPRVPLAGVTVTATEANFTTVAGTAVTNASGGYSMEIPPGVYYIWSNRTGTWGGGGLPDRTNISAGNDTVDLTAYPYIGYGNETFVLPAWNRLAAYMHGGNVMDSQQPVLSWTQDGAYYVNATDQLVFYSFTNGSVTDLAPWVPLYENVMDYSGWENQEFITPDGAWVYGLGCLATCRATSSVTLYAVNVTTGHVVDDTLSLTDSALESNAQVNLVGRNGNLSTAVLITDTGRLWMYDLWNGSEWEGPQLPFFEANNIYWLPYLSSYINIEAGGSSADGIDQWELVGPGDGTGFTDVFSSHFGSGFVSNAVTGPVFNVSSRTLVFDALYHGAWDTFEYSVGPRNILDKLTVLASQTPGGSVYAHESLTMNIATDEHRASLIDSGPAFASTYWPFFDNQSFVVDPFHDSYYETNQTPEVVVNTTYAPDQAWSDSDAEDGLFYNGSYLISPAAFDCDFGPCPINGANGAPNGTIWWLWRVGSPEFPQPASAPLAQTTGPAEVQLSNSTATGALVLGWTAPTSGQFPILNYTVAWGLSPGNYSSSASVPPGETQYTVGGLPGSVPVYFEVAAWNLHWHGTWATGQALSPPGPPEAPGHLAAKTVFADSVTLRWTPPPDPVSNYTVFVGRSCGKFTQSIVTGPTLTATVSGLLPHTRYCFAVQSWNSYGGSGLSAGIQAETLSKIGGRPTVPASSGSFPLPPPKTATPGVTVPFLSFPNPRTPWFWGAAALVAAGAVVTIRGRRGLGGGILVLGLLLIFL